MGQVSRLIRDFVTPALVFCLSGVVLYDHLEVHAPRTVAPGVNGKLLGRNFVGPMAASLGDAWTSAADILEQGKAVGDAQAALQVRWQEGRSKAFAGLVAPEFSRVLKEGAEPADPAQRAAVVKLWRDFAAGLKGAR